MLKPGRLKLIGRAQHASDAEVADNPRARSAVLRVAECAGGSQ
jgi:16S rRNA (cytosine1402-N4)-methyltransferase